MNLCCHLAGAGVCHAHSGPQPLPQQLVPLLQGRTAGLWLPATPVLVLLFLATTLGGSPGAASLGVSVLGG